MYDYFLLVSIILLKFYYFSKKLLAGGGGGFFRSYKFFHDIKKGSKNIFPTNISLVRFKTHFP